MVETIATAVTTRMTTKDKPITIKTSKLGMSVKMADPSVEGEPLNTGFGLLSLVPGSSLDPLPVSVSTMSVSHLPLLLL